MRVVRHGFSGEARFRRLPPSPSCLIWHKLPTPIPLDDSLPVACMGTNGTSGERIQYDLPRTRKHENTKTRKLRLALPVLSIALLLATACPQKPGDNTGLLLLLGSSTLPGTGTGTGSAACTVPTAGTGGCTSHPVCASTNTQNTGTVYASCNYGLATCTDFGTGNNASNMAGADTSCATGGGTWTLGTACPTANRLATAVLANSGRAMAYHFYSPWTTADARSTMDSMMASAVPGATCTYSEP